MENRKDSFSQKKSFETLSWTGKELLLLDQRKLPNIENYVICKTSNDVANAISNMVVRGAPAIGCAAAFGYVLGAQEIVNFITKNLNKDSKADEWLKIFNEKIKEVKFNLYMSRPTAVNLGWALDKMHSVFNTSKFDFSKLLDDLTQKACLILDDDIKTNKKIGEIGKGVIKQNANILTYCNAGALATAGYGTALGVIRAAFFSGNRIKVYSSETRPFLQGARLTTWELMKDQIPVTLITDNMCGYLMKDNKIDVIIVGADRVTANGDVINKIGTYMLSVLAKENKIPFYVACPWSTIDLNTMKGDEVKIEERSESEVTGYNSEIWTPKGVKIYNPAFDVTPFSHVTGLITERGLISPLNFENLAKLSC